MMLFYLLSICLLGLINTSTGQGNHYMTCNGGTVAKTEIRQCSWINIDDQQEDGVIKTCVFVKNADSTVLRVVWNGSLRLFRRGGTTAACRRWFFTLNGVECQTPATIDTQLHTREEDSDHPRPAYLDGLCTGINAGQVDVTFNVGDCTNQGTYQKGDALTGWTSTCRIIVEELDVANPGLIG